MESVVRGKLYPSFPFLFCGKANYTFWFAYKVNWFYDTTPLVPDLRFVCLLGVWHLEPPNIWCNYDCCHKYSNVITPEGTLGLVLVKKKEERWKKEEDKEEKEEVYFPPIFILLCSFFQHFQFSFTSKEIPSFEGCQLPLPTNLPN